MDWSPVVAAGVSALGSLSNNAINSFRADADRDLQLQLYFQNRAFQRQDQQWTEDYAKRMMDYEYQNYSSPSAQMASYKAAGLNPYLMSQQGSVSGGDQVKPPSVPVPSAMSTPDLRRPSLSDPFSGGVSAIIQGSAVQNQRLAALSEVLKSAPEAFKALGKKTFDSVMSSLFGQIIDSSMLENISKNNELISQHNEKVASVEAAIASTYGVRDAQNKIAIQEQTFNKMAAEIGLMSSEGRLNDAKIDELMSSYIRNLADAWKLKQEGSYFVANAETVNAIRDLTVSSLEVELAKAGFENRIKGYYEGSGLDSYLNGSRHSGKTADILRIQENAEGSELVKALDRVLGKYLKVSAAP